MENVTMESVTMEKDVVPFIGFANTFPKPGTIRMNCVFLRCLTFLQCSPEK